MNKSNRSHSCAVASVSFVLCMAAGQAGAQALAATESRIALVTLYPGSATVERVARVAAGSKKLTFGCLPVGLDVQSLSLVADAQVRLGELSVANEKRDAPGVCPASGLDSQIRALEDKIALLDAEDNALTVVTGYLKSMTVGDTPASGTRVVTDPKSLPAMAEALRRSGQETLTRKHQIFRQKGDLDRLLTPLKTEKARGMSENSRVVSVSVTLDTPQDADVKLTYQVSGPGWAPTYRASLDTRTNVLRLERRATVAQSTGEDWLGVAMRLSTGQPSRGTTGPKPSPWSLAVLEAAPASFKSQSDMRAYAAPPPSPAPAAAPALGSMTPSRPSFDIHVFEGTFATEFAVPQRIEVPTGGQQITLSLGAQDEKVTLWSRTTPALDASAWLVAELPQPEGVWPDGKLQLYRDGAFVGTDTLRPALKGTLSLSFGRDPLVVVRAEQPSDTRSTTGFVGSRAQRKIAHAFTVENRHRTPIALQVLESTPVSKDEKISVETLFSPTPESLNWHDQPGVVLWSTSLDATKTARFTATYTIGYPKEVQLDERR